jgi:hypothetical protein
MTTFSPKIEIINHFDNLINQIDIDIELGLKKFNDQQLLSEVVGSSANDRFNFKDSYDFFIVRFTNNKFEPPKQQQLESWPEETKVVDYLKQVRMKTIEKLRKAQEDTLEYYKLNSARFKSELANGKKKGELMSELFAYNFYFQVHLKQSEKSLWAFNRFTFATDFYMSSSQIDSLE